MSAPETWVSVVAATVPASVAAFRTAPLEVAWASESGKLMELWLRGFDGADEDLLRAVPSARRVRVTDEGLLRMRPDGSTERLPYRQTPQLRWRPIAEVLTVKFPELTHTPTVQPETTDWKLVRTQAQQSTTALLTTVAHLAAFAKTAPRVRLERLRFCWVDAQALVLGQPLPPLPGEAYWGEEHLRPVGLDFAHAKLLSGVAPRPYGYNADARTLWRADGSYVVLPARAFAALGRDNVDPAQAALVRPAASLTPPPSSPPPLPS